MTKACQKLNSLGVEIPSILLPRFALTSPEQMQKWPVIACDQFTQNCQYWEKAKAAVSGSPSTLNLIFPEAFLHEGDAQKRIDDIHSAMKRYLLEGVFDKPRRGFIYAERDTPFNKKRRGLIAAIDLEKYDWQASSKTLIRSTEGTVPDRLPPRMDIRRGAPLELPHILLLIDDEKDSLLGALEEIAKKNPPVYDTPLMQESGRVAGWFLDQEENGKSSRAEVLIAEKLDELCNRSAGLCLSAEPPLLFAVGDGNHSLAAAKGIWEEYKNAGSGGTLPVHPCRYALVEIENIYDPAVQFQPIHRLVLNAGFEETIAVLSQLPGFSCRPVSCRHDLSHLCKTASEGSAKANCFGIAAERRYALIETSDEGIATACLQPLLDGASLNGRPLSVDYIHDEHEVFRLAAASGRVTGILLPPVQKTGFFETIARNGPLPRKSFSMGHACEKRFYLECRELFA